MSTEHWVIRIWVLSIYDMIIYDWNEVITIIFILRVTDTKNFYATWQKKPYDITTAVVFLVCNTKKKNIK